ncbi:MAG: hypothetical protein LBR39_01410 [Coriobacteriales bacterium]|jgi:very-short-patch-repair endonuclease|nr:hypothetical protein [Coriobacteriales bacterium]
MKWFISHDSALQFWRYYQLGDARVTRYSCVRRVSQKLPAAKLPDAGSLRAVELWSLDKPLHILVGSKAGRKGAGFIKSHILTTQLPAGSFLKAKDGPYVSSPELCFVQMAGKLTLPELIALGYELCGSYRLAANESTGQGFTLASPLTTVAKLQAFANAATGLKGRKQAMRAIKYVLADSRSPMETILAMLLCLPYRLGGYGLPAPQLNTRITGSAEAKRTTHRSHFVCDLYWADYQVDVEYDSRDYHLSEEQVNDNAKRRNTLAAMGVEVITVTRRQIVSNSELRRVAEALAVLLDKRLRTPEQNFNAAHIELRRQLLPRVRG